MKVSKGNNSFSKQGKIPRDIIPPNFKEIRNANPIIKTEEIFNIKKPKKVKNYLKLYPDFPEWPKQQEVEKFNKSQLEITLEKFVDPQHEEIFLPISLLDECAGTFVWKRPYDYIIDYYLKNDISAKYPLKNLSKFKSLIYEMYYSDTCPLDLRKKKKSENKKDFSFLNNNYNSDNKKAFKIFFKHFEKSDFSIINLIQKEEFELDAIEEENEYDKSENNNQPIFTSLGGSKILIEEKSSFFTKWISSILQFIREFDILDEDDDPIWKKIYPQQNGVPFYNPNGRYWVKLHHRGKLKKIEVDDLVPCNKDMECLLPKCQDIEEIWPVIISKAIIKLFSYKFKLQKNSNCVVGDPQIIQAISGYYINILDPSDSSIDLKKYIKKIELKAIEDNDSQNEKEKDKEKDRNFFLFFNKNATELKEEYKEKEKEQEKEIINNNQFININENLPPNEKEKIYIPNFLNLKKKGSNTSKDLPIVSFENIKISQILTEKANEILLKKTNIDRALILKSQNLKRINHFHQNLKEGNFLKLKNFHPDNLNLKTPKDTPKKTIKFPNFSENKPIKFNLTDNKNSEQNKKKISYLPDKLISDLNKFYSALINEKIIESVSKEYEEMIEHYILRKNRKQKKSTIVKNLFVKNLRGTKKSLEVISTSTKNFKNMKKSNNIMFGVCYPVVEAFENRGFTKSRFNSIDINELKEVLNEMKTSFKKTNKEEKREFLEKINVLGNTYKEKKNKNIKEMQAKGNNSYFFKICNNCKESPQLNLICDFTEEEIEIILKCYANSWDYPPFEYYKNLSDAHRVNKIAHEKKLKHFTTMETLSPIREIKEPQGNLKDNKRKKNRAETTAQPIIELGKIKENDDKGFKLMNMNTFDTYNTTNTFDTNDFENLNNKERELFPVSIEKKSSKMLDISTDKTSQDNLNLSPNRKTLNISTLLKKRNTIDPNNKPFLNAYEEVNYMATDDYLIDIYTELIGSNFEKYDNVNKIKRKNIKGHWMNLDEIKKNFEYFVLFFKNDKLKIKSNFNTFENLTKDKFNKSDDQYKIYLISLKEPEEIEPIQDKKKKQIEKEKEKFSKEKEKKKNISPQTILIEFSANNGKIGDIEELNTFIVFDIYELNSKNNDKNINFKENFSLIKNKETKDKNKNNNKIYFNGNLKLIYENVQMRGFYEIFYHDNFESEKDYLLYIKSSFSPFGYNLKILTQLGSVEPMSYDKYLTNQGGFKIAKSHSLNIPNLESNSKFLLSKFLINFKNFENFLTMRDFIIHLKKDYLEVKLIVNIQDEFLSQFLTLFIGKIEKENCGNFRNFKNKIEDKVYPINEIFYLDLNSFNIDDEIFVKFFNLFR